MAEDDDYQKWLAGYLPAYRDELLRGGMSKEDVDWAVRSVWTPPAITIATVEDYKRACALHGEMAKTVPKGDWKSPASVRLTALGGEMIRFEEEYEREHGRLPDTGKRR